jgi:hypothetical protein
MTGGLRVGAAGPRVFGVRPFVSSGVRWPVAFTILAAVWVVEVLGLAARLLWWLMAQALEGIAQLARGTATACDWASRHMRRAHAAVRPNLKAQNK